jgi:hypothetical protein
MENKFLNEMVSKIISTEVRKAIIKESQEAYEVYHVMCDNEPIETSKSEQGANEIVDRLKKEHPGKQFIIEKKKYKSHDDMLDKLDELGESLEENENTNMKEIKESKKFTQFLMKNLKEVDTVEIDKPIEDECEECDNNMNESNKKTLKLNERQLVNMIVKIIKESAVPGLETYKKAHSQSGKENKENITNVTSKIKKSLSIENNDNPKFPKQVGKGEKVASKNTKEEDEEVSNSRGGTLLDLDYDQEPDAKFKTRAKESLSGNPKSGNSDKKTGNTIETKTGENLAKAAETKKKAKKEMPMYKKEPQPVKIVKENKLIAEEILKIKKTYNYNEKTQ